MVRKAFPASYQSFVLTSILAVAASASVRVQDRTGAARVADVLLWGMPMAPASQTSDLPADAQKPLGDYRIREQAFRSALKTAPNASPDEQALFEKRVGIERVIFCLFPRRDIAKLAASYASDADVSEMWEGADGPRREAAFIDNLLHDLPQPWLAPYLNLIAGHRKLCASQLDGSDALRDATAADARRQLTRARDGGHPLVRVAADYLLSTAARSCSPSP